MKTLYLHIGTAKTATSSIQKYCLINQEVLNKYNYSYPLMPFEYPGVNERRNGHFLLYTFHEERWTDEDKQEYRDNLAEGLKRVKQIFKEVDNIVLSDESLWTASSYTRYNPIEIIKKDADENNYTVKVIVYLRRQDNYISSRWNQFVKYEGRPQTFKNHVKWIMNNNRLIVEYDKSLDAISNLIGKDNVIVRRFEPSTWINNSIYEDFANAISFENVAELQLPEEDMNPGIKGNAVEIKRIINTMSSIEPDDKVHIGKIAGTLSSDLKDADMYSMFSVEETKEFLANFKDGNDYIAKEYLGIEPPLFSETIKDLPKWEANNKYMTEDIIKFFTAMYADQKHMIDELVEKNKELSNQNKSLSQIIERLNGDTKKLFTSMNKIKHPFRTLWKHFFKKGVQ